ncbi:hypothetical protein ACFO4E_15625 [Nocardiopsis mangrovi]|uniref:DUF4352 domain-containing protein n=1 Tax=Nocardiopsis mangrovi TaxID=1179818 RepID=A0ABV9DXW4_9ACTN
MAPESPTPIAEPAPQASTPRWVLPTVTGVVALIIGFAGGWFVYQQYMVFTVADADADALDDVGEDAGEATGEEDAELLGLVPEGQGAEAPTEERPTNGFHDYTDVSLGDPVASFSDEAGEVYTEQEGAVYVPVTVTAENISGAETIPGMEWAFAYDSDGEQHRSMAFTGEDAGYGLSPGLSAEGVAFHFQVPEGTTLEWITLQYPAAEMEGVPRGRRSEAVLNPDATKRPRRRREAAGARFDSKPETKPLLRQCPLGAVGPTRLQRCRRR